MMVRFTPFLTILTLLAGCLLAFLAGCDARIERFEPNEVFAMTVARSRSMPTEVAMDHASQVVTELFGTPDRPVWPTLWLQDEALIGLVDPDRLKRAAGAVSSDRDGVNHGLFRKHCVNCHGLAGSGAGPTSLFQNPYPRDFRHGIFKWKSTERSAKPTRDDLRRLLKEGVASTAMPSFALVGSEDTEALIDYVIYLSIRGEVERRLVAAAVDELAYGDVAPDEPEWRLVIESDSSESLLESGAEAGELVIEVLQRVVESWRAAESEVVSVPEPEPLAGNDQAASIGRGKELFHGQIANCAGCHGPDGNGLAVTLDYDDWTKEYSTRIGLTPTDREAMRPFRDAGALPPRQSKPRNFAEGVLRGGDDPDSIYRRITQGIAGTPMPRVEVVAEPSGVGLTSDQVWDLVRYVQSLDRNPR